MDVLSLREAIVSEHEQFATWFTIMFAEGLRKKIEVIYFEERNWSGWAIQIERIRCRT